MSKLFNCSYIVALNCKTLNHLKVSSRQSNRITLHVQLVSLASVWMCSLDLFTSCFEAEWSLLLHRFLEEMVFEYQLQSRKIFSEV